MVTLKPAKLTSRSLTKAHLALAQRPSMKAALAEAMDAVAKSLSGRLGAEVQLEASLLDASVRGVNSLAYPGAFAIFALDEVGGFAVAEVEPQLASALVDRLAGGPGEPIAPQPLSESEEAGTALLALDVLAALRPAACEKALGPRLVRVVQSAAEVGSIADLRLAQLAVRVRVTCGAATGFVRVLIPASALRFWLEGVEPEVVEPAANVAAASLPFDVRGGRAQLSLEDLASLQPGDVVLFDGLAGPLDTLTGTVRLVGTRFAITGSIGSDGFTVAEHAMNDATQEMKAPELPVDVEVELAQVRLTLAELGGVKPGGVISLHIRAGEPVTLKVGGEAVAVAELVDIEGEIGARILRLSK